MLELLAVLVIVALLGTLLLSAIHGFIASSNLKRGTDALLNLMELARQSASTRNLPVELRLYQDRTKPADPNGVEPYRLAAIAIPATAIGTSADQFLTTPVALPGDVIVDSSLSFSTLLNTQLGSPNLQPKAETETAGAPLAIRQMPYIRVTYLANGTVALDASQKWCLTLINETRAQSSANTTPAANFATIILDPGTSRARLFEP